MSINSINFTGHDRKHRSGLADVAIAGGIGAAGGYAVGRYFTPIKDVAVFNNFVKKVDASALEETKGLYTKKLTNLEKNEAKLSQIIEDFAKNKSNSKFNGKSKDKNPIEKLGKIREELAALKATTADKYAKTLIANTKKEAPKQYDAMIHNHSKKIIEAFGDNKKCIEGIKKEIKTGLGKRFALIGGVALATTAVIDKLIQRSRHN